MINRIRLLLIFNFWVISSGVAAAEFVVPACTGYCEQNPDGVQFSPESGITGWSNPELKISWFGEFQSATPEKAPGTLQVTVALKLEAGKSSKLQLTVAGQSHSVTATGSSDQELTKVDFGEFQLVQAGYERLTLESLNAPGVSAGSPQSLILSGPAAEKVHFNLKPRRNAASVHLAYQIPKDSKITWFYSEVTAVEDPVTTFYMACGFHRGYFGMQVNSPTERRIIFSVWDAAEGKSANNRSDVDKQNHVQLVAKGAGVHASVFGNEGTGGHSHLKYLWKTGEKQRFLLTAEPTDGTYTIYSGYYYHPDQQAWMLISSMKAPMDGGYLKGLHGFSENFGGSTGYLRRKALYGNQWVRDVEGTWTELTQAKFSHDSTGKEDRLDRFMGVEGQQFFLSHGGFIPGMTKFGTPFTRPANGTPPEIKLP